MQCLTPGCTWISQRWPYDDRVDTVLKAGGLAMRELEYHERQAHGKEEKDVVEPPAHVPLVEQHGNHLQKRARKRSAAVGQALAKGKPEKETEEKRVVATSPQRIVSTIYRYANIV